MEEIWKDVKGWEGKHQISNYGRIKTFNWKNTGKTKIWYGTLTPDGYYTITFVDKNRREKYPVHRLVALTFGIEPTEQFKNVPLDELDINHKDENKQNNCITNLEWCDISYNNAYGTRNKRISETLKGFKRTPFTDEHKNKLSESHKGKLNNGHSKVVLQIDKNTNEVIKEWPSIAEINRQLGYIIKNISNCCTNKPHYKTAYGYKWVFKN